MFDWHRCQLTRNNGSQRLSQHGFDIKAFFAYIKMLLAHLKTLLASIKAFFTPIQTFLASTEKRQECQQSRTHFQC